MKLTRKSILRRCGSVYYLEAEILIRGCMILPMVQRGIISSGLIAIKDHSIIYVGKESDAPRFKADEILDGHGKIAMPGLINCHTHAAMSILRGIAEDQELDKWLRETIWPLEAKRRPLDVYHGVLLSCIEMIKSGTTCFCDMYFHEDMVAKAVEESGLRAVLASGIIEAGNAERGRRMLEESVEVAKKYNGYADGRITTQIGPHTACTCSLSLLKKVREAASSLKVGVHIHLAESKDVSRLVKERYGRGEVELLSDTGFLGPDVLAAHCIHLSQEDIALLAGHNVKVVYNPVANMKLASGIPRVKDLLDAGITVGLGTDGPASNNSLDMFETMKFAALLQKIFYMDPKVLPAWKVLEMATIDGARALGIDKSVGSLEIGKRADLILIDFEEPHLTPIHDPYASLVYSACGSDVDTTIVDGKILMENGEVKTLDEDDVIKKGRETASDLISR